jgi:hypothetical protein
MNENQSQIEIRNQKDSIGFAAFFTYKENVEILYEDWIIDPVNFRKFPHEIKHRRNIMLYITGFQIVASILAILFMLFRRSFIYLFINSVSLLLSFVGLYGSLKANVLLLILHCVFTTSITGGFFVYEILNLFFGSDTSYGNTKRANDTLIMFLFSLPYLYDCFVGIYNYFFLKIIAEFNSEKIKKQELLKSDGNKKEYSEEQISQFISKVDDKLCVICMDSSRNTVLNPCGHILCCENCAKSIFDHIFTTARCPVCKTKCSSYLKIYVS